MESRLIVFTVGAAAITIGVLVLAVYYYWKKYSASNGYEVHGADIELQSV